MTEAEYLDKKRFPLTTQDGLDLKSQKMIDAINYDDLIEATEIMGKVLSPKQQQILAELKEKLGR